MFTLKYVKGCTTFGSSALDPKVVVGPVVAISVMALPETSACDAISVEVDPRVVPQPICIRSVTAIGFFTVTTKLVSVLVAAGDCMLQSVCAEAVMFTRRAQCTRSPQEIQGDGIAGLDTLPAF